MRSNSRDERIEEAVEMLELAWSPDEVLVKRETCHLSHDTPDSKPLSLTPDCRYGVCPFERSPLCVYIYSTIVYYAASVSDVIV